MESPAKGVATVLKNPQSVRLLHVVGESSFGGGSIIITRLAEMASRMGWHVDVLTTDRILQEKLRAAEIGVIDLDVVRRKVDPLRDLSGLIRLWSFLVRQRYDIVHTHTSKGGFIGRLAAKAARVPTIVHTVHGFAFHEETPERTVRTYALLERIAAKACDRIVAVSNYHREWAIRLKIADAVKIAAIPNGIPSARVEPILNREVMRRALNVASDERLLLNAGRLANEKGLEDLLAAMKWLAHDPRFKFKLLIAGSGPLESTLESKARDFGIQHNVIFSGFRNDVGNLLAASDIVVLPTLREGLSISLLEAMAAGKPIVTTTIGSNIEATQDGVGARLVRTHDPRRLADAILELSSDDSRCQSMANRARGIIERHYSEERMLESYRAEYLQLLRAARGDAEKTALAFSQLQEQERAG
jgi:glycosyltransferase involved in cell wall biosynthesis